MIVPTSLTSSVPHFPSQIPEQPITKGTRKNIYVNRLIINLQLCWLSRCCFFHRIHFLFFIYNHPLPPLRPPWRCDAVIQLLTEMFSHVAEYAFRAFAITKPGHAKPGKDVTKHMFSQFAKKAKTNTKKNFGCPVWYGPIFAQLFHRFSATTHCSNRSFAVVFRQMGSDSGMQNESIIIMSWAHWNFWQLLIFTARRLVM